MQDEAVPRSRAREFEPAGYTIERPLDIQRHRRGPGGSHEAGARQPQAGAAPGGAHQDQSDQDRVDCRAAGVQQDEAVKIGGHVPRSARTACR